KMSSNGSTQPNIIQSVCDFIFYIIWVNITIAITIIMAFSINVASVIGNFSAVPRQAQRIDFLSKSVLVTPTVVVLNIISVAIRAISISKRIKNISPRVVSMNGYIQPYIETRFANGSYILKDSGKFFKSSILKKLNTMKNKPIKSSITALPSQFL